MSKQAVEFNAQAFDMEDVHILGGPFKHAMDLNEQYLLELDPDRLLARFREYAGLEPKAPQYEGWEAMTLSGHTLGHYLSACSMMYAQLKDAQFKERVDYIVEELRVCQEAHKDGYVSGIPGAKETFEEVAKGNIISKGFDLNGIWAPLYTIHKFFAGLRDALHLVGNKEALQIAIKMADWLDNIVANLGEDQMEELMACEFGGINEVLADLYADTGDEKYLKLAQRFWHKLILDPLSNQTDSLPGVHANTQIPKVIGLAREYELTNDNKRKETSEYFWKQVTKHHSYVTGGNSNEEYFGEPGKLSDRLGPHTTETCNTYNMLKLTDHMFKWHSKAAIADYYERGLFNHILASQDPKEGRVTYFLSLDMAGFKEYNRKFDHFTCCVGTGMENHASYNKGIYYYKKDSLYVNQFIPSSLNWSEKRVNVYQETEYPNDGKVKLKIQCEGNTPLSMLIRYPYWAMEGMAIKINGESYPVAGEPSSYVEINRLWQDGDEVHIDIPMTLRLEAMPDNPNRVAIMYGPLVLAGELGPIDDPNSKDSMYTPVIIPKDKSISNWVVPVEGKQNTFRLSGAGYPRDVELYPFYQMHDKLYTIYWDLFTEQEWEKLESDYVQARENLKVLEEATIDYVQPGEMQPERDHNFNGENTRVGSVQNRKCRTAYGGWFTFDLKVNLEEDQLLVISYAKDMQRRETEYDIYIGDTKLGEPQEGFDETTRIYNVIHEIPKEEYEGKDKITVRFKSHPEGRVRRVFGLRTVGKDTFMKLID